MYKNVLQVLISTVSKSDVGFIKPIYKFHKDLPPTIVINQFNEIEVSNNEYENLEIVNSQTKGLSNSRNEALLHANAGIVVFTDDDVCFPNNAFQIVEKYHQTFQEYDIIIFKAATFANEPFRHYPDQIKQLNIKECAFVCSIEMTAKLESLKRTSLSFDGRFGLGSKFTSNEEWIFLSDAIKKGLKVLFVPEYIVQHEAYSSGTVYDRCKIQATGASLLRVYPSVGWIRLLAMMRHVPKMNLKNISKIQFVKYLFQGAYLYYRSSK